MMASLLLSEGTPMIVSGDEILRTQRGNNNAYCQDNDTNWFDWSLVEKNEEMFRFVRTLIAFRKSQPNVRRPMFLTGQPPIEGELPDVSWYGPDGQPMNWTEPLRSLTCVLGTAGLTESAARPVMMLLHAGGDGQDFVIPSSVRRKPWKLFIDTAAEAPADIFPNLDGPALPANGRMRLVNHSLRCFVG
jgi:glycogen operon protein